MEADLHERYGVDVEDRALMRVRSWRWLKVRIAGLLACESRLHRALNPDAYKVKPLKLPNMPRRR